MKFKVSTYDVWGASENANSDRLPVWPSDFGSPGETGLGIDRLAAFTIVNHPSSSVVGAGPGEVFALSCALSRHQGCPSPQCAARSWISAHRRCAVFPVLSRQKVWVFRPWQSSYQAKRVQPLSNLVGALLP